jgi:protein-S-isoprenylcysteine O-methyltransferase Ste14
MVVMGTALFLPAWLIDYWQAWVYLALFLVSVGAITLYVMKNDPALLERRIKAGPAAEKVKTQKSIQFVAQIAFVAMFIVPAIDHRLMWSQLPICMVICGDILVVAGFLIVFLVFKENSFTSAIIEVDKNQKVVFTGPYALVRHPMYSGGLVMLLGTPLALGSWWGLLPFVLIAGVIVWRLLDEERFLIKNLPGYAEYRAKVGSRLIPGIF